MTIDETKKVIEKIKAFRPFFQTGNSLSEEVNLRKEWFSVLEPYSFTDVERKLVEYFKDGDNLGRIPDVYYITKFLKTEKEKKESQGFSVRCNLCQKEMPLEKYDSHFDRCSSSNYIVEQAKKYYNQKINREDLYKLTQEEFDSRYLKFIQNLSTKIIDEEEKNRLEKLSKMLNGEKITFSLNEMI